MHVVQTAYNLHSVIQLKIYDVYINLLGSERDDIFSAEYINFLSHRTIEN